MSKLFEVEEIGMKKQFIVAGTVVVLLVAGLSGCFEQTPTGTVSAAQIKANALQSTESINSYNFIMTGEIGTTVGDDSMTASFNANGAIDISNQKLKMEMSSSVPEQPAATEIAFYIINNVLYSKTGIMGDQQWIKTNITSLNTIWNSYDQMEMQKQLLEVSNVQKLNDEVVDGVNCYVLQVEPDLEKYFEIMMNQLETSGSGNLSLGDISDIIEGWSIKQWIAKDTNLIKKIYNQMAMSYSFFDQEITMDMEITVVFSNYNTAVTIELPEEAENALWST